MYVRSSGSSGRVRSAVLVAVVIVAVLLVIASRVAWAGCVNTWESQAATPAVIGGFNEGRLVTAAGTDTIFALRGRFGSTFYRYNISGDTWATMATTPADISGGGALAQAGTDTLFALRGGNNTTFYRYTISANTWATMAPTPAVIWDGGALTQAGTDTIFALSAFSTTGFFRYTISADSWDTMTPTPAGIRDGGALTQAGTDTIFALRGNATTTFFRYTISANSWDTMAALPSTVDRGGSLLYPGSGDFIYATRGTSTGTLFRYSISGNSWDTAANNAPANFRAGGGLAYPGTGSFLYGLAGNGLTNFSRFFLVGSTPDTPTSLTQTKTDSTPVAVGASITDTTSIRFNVRASDLADTFRIQIELRPAATAFTSPVNVTIDTAIFFQSGFSATSAAETLAVTVNALAAGGYHWQVRVVDSCNDSTGWVNFNAAATHFTIGAAADTSLPVASVVTPADTHPVVNAPIATTESFVQINFSGDSTPGDSRALLAACTGAAASGANVGADYVETSALVNGRDSAVIPIWTNEASMRLFVGLRSDTGTLGASGNLPSGITATDAGRTAFGATAILIEFAGANNQVIGDSKTTRYIGDSFAYTIRYLLSDTSVALYRALGFDTSAGSSSFRFWYADTYGGAWTMDTTVTVTVTAAPAPWNLAITVSGITKDLPGGLGGAGAATSLGSGSDGFCVISRLDVPGTLLMWLRTLRDLVLGCGGAVGRLLVGAYYQLG